jgi:uncharacterized membrane protein YdjX (TVP38/TMEM64 family)
MMENFTVAALAEFAEQQPLLGFGLFAVGNVIATSITPVPMGVFFCALAGLMYGAIIGACAYIVTCVFGAWLTFLITRCFRDRIIRRLGEYATVWERIDKAIMREGVVICLLWRIAPIAPFVLSSVLISLTTITQWQYVWTTSIGIIPSTVPIVSAAALGRNLATGEADRMQIAFNVGSMLVGVYVVYRLALIAKAVLGRDVSDAELSGDGTPRGEISQALSKMDPRVVARLRSKFGEPPRDTTILL